MKESEITFEANMKELEDIVKALEEGNIPLADMVTLYERGTQLGRRCMEMLEAYEGKLATLTINDKEDYAGEEA